MKFSDNVEKAFFVFSLIVFVLAYGVAAGNYGWFPRGFLDRALGQARNVYKSLPFTDKALNNTGPKVYDREGIRIENSTKIQPGLTLITSLWNWDNSGQLEAGAKLINQKGEIIHKWVIDRSTLFPNSISLHGHNPKRNTFHGAYLFPNGDLLLNLERVGTVRLDSCGEVVWKISRFNHHSIARAEDGTFWIPAFTKKPRSGSDNFPNGFPGFKENLIQANQILHVSEDGQILNNINVLDLLYMNDLERYIPKMLINSDVRNVDALWNNDGGDKIVDITHLNDVEPLSSSIADQYPLFKAGDLLISLRDLNLLLVFDPKTMEVKWHTTKSLNHQHDADFVGNGWIGVFDNNRDGTKRGTMLGGSRIVFVQPHTDTTEIRFPKQRSEAFYTAYMGKWQMLDNNNMLLTEADTGRVIEVTRRGKTVWEWIHKPVGDSRIPNIGKATRYDLTKEDVASWPCFSENTSDNTTQQEGG